MKTLIAAALMAVSTVASAQSVYDKYGEVREDILKGASQTDIQQTMRFTHALGYVIGVSDALASASVVCVPVGINKGNLARAVVLAADRAGANRSSNAAEPIGLALVSVFPCSNV